MRTRSRLVSASAAALLALTALAGCAASGGASSNYGAPAVDSAQHDSAQQESGGAGAVAPGAPTVVDDRALVTTGQMGIETPDVTVGAERVQAIVAEHGGRIDARSEQSGGYSYATLTIRVPADDYDELVESLRDVGTVKYVETSIVDVTMETVDLNARISSLEASVTSLRAMLAQATNVSDMLEVESTLSEREAELQSLKAQQQALADQVAMSTLTVTITNDELANPPKNEGGFLGGLQAGWNALMSFFNGLLTLIGFALPGLLVLALIGGIVVAIVFAAIRSRRAQRASVGAHAPAAAMAGEATGEPVTHEHVAHETDDLPPHPSPENPSDPEDASSRRA